MRDELLAAASPQKPKLTSQPQSEHDRTIAALKEESLHLAGELESVRTSLAETKAAKDQAIEDLSSARADALKAREAREVIAANLRDTTDRLSRLAEDHKAEIASLHDKAIAILKEESLRLAAELESVRAKLAEMTASRDQVIADLNSARAQEKEALQGKDDLAAKVRETSDAQNRLTEGHERQLESMREKVARAEYRAEAAEKLARANKDVWTQEFIESIHRGSPGFFRPMPPDGPG